MITSIFITIKQTYVAPCFCGLDNILKLLAAFRLCASIPDDVAVLVEKEDVQFYIQTLE